MSYFKASRPPFTQCQYLLVIRELGGRRRSGICQMILNFRRTEPKRRAVNPWFFCCLGKIQGKQVPARGILGVKRPDDVKPAERPSQDARSFRFCLSLPGWLHTLFVPRVRPRTTARLRRAEEGLGWMSRRKWRERGGCLVMRVCPSRGPFILYHVCCVNLMDVIHHTAA